MVLTSGVAGVMAGAWTNMRKMSRWKCSAKNVPRPWNGLGRNLRAGYVTIRRLMPIYARNALLQNVIVNTENQKLFSTRTGNQCLSGQKASLWKRIRNTTWTRKLSSVRSGEITRILEHGRWQTDLF